MDGVEQRLGLSVCNASELREGCGRPGTVEKDNLCKMISRVKRLLIQGFNEDVSQYLKIALLHHNFIALCVALVNLESICS